MIALQEFKVDDWVLVWNSGFSQRWLAASLQVS